MRQFRYPLQAALDSAGAEESVSLAQLADAAAMVQEAGLRGRGLLEGSAPPTGPASAFVLWAEQLQACRRRLAAVQHVFETARLAHVTARNRREALVRHRSRCRASFLVAATAAEEAEIVELNACTPVSLSRPRVKNLAP